MTEVLTVGVSLQGVGTYTKTIKALEKELNTHLEKVPFHTSLSVFALANKCLEASEAAEDRCLYALCGMPSRGPDCCN